MNTMYPASVESFTDEQIQVLMAEIEDAGVMNCDDGDWSFDDNSWEQSAYNRYWELHEAARFRKYGPREPASLSQVTTITRAAMDKYLDGLFIAKNAFTGKIGQNMTLRMPVKFGGSAGPSLPSYMDDSDIPALNPTSYVLS